MPVAVVAAGGGENGCAGSVGEHQRREPQVGVTAQPQPGGQEPEVVLAGYRVRVDVT